MKNMSVHSQTVQICLEITHFPKVVSFCSILDLACGKILCYFPLSGHCITKPEVIFKLEQGTGPWRVEVPEQSRPGQQIHPGHQI